MFFLTSECYQHSLHWIRDLQIEIEFYDLVRLLISYGDLCSVVLHLSDGEEMECCKDQ